MSPPGKLYLLPVPISEENGADQLPQYNFALVKALRYFIAEDARTARRFLKWFGYDPIDRAEILLLNEHTRSAEIALLIKPLLEGNDVGLMSDAGCPGIADPGADLIKIAHQKNIQVVPLVGPSSIVLSIMASGFNGQNFSFAGYLPIEKEPRVRRLKELEQLALKHRQAQFFIETPYRNEQLLECIIQTLQPQTLLFIGKNIGAAGQQLLTKTAADWKRSPFPEMHKIPVVFGIYA